MNAPVQNKKELLERLKSHHQAIIGYGVVQLGIFGSFVRDEAGPDSDIDFFIDFIPEKKTLKNVVGLADYLQELLGREVEIVTPASLNKHMGKYITAEVEYVPIAA